MKITSHDGWRLAAIVLLAATSASAQTIQGASPTPPNATPVTAPGADPAPVASADQVSYLFGLLFGAQLNNAGVANEVQPDAIMRGINDGLQGKPVKPGDQQQIQAYMRTAMQTATAKNQTAAKAFLARNAHEKGIVTTASGLQYKIISPGERSAPAITSADTVTVEYKGTLLNGTEFDSSYSRGTPATFPVNGVIKGWQEALALMKPGAKWQLFIPPDLGYGAAARPKIPGGSALIFDVHVLRIEPKTAVPAAPLGTPGKPIAQ